jgi:hypothetical protein
MTIRDVKVLNMPELSRVTAGNLTISDNTFGSLNLGKLQSVDQSLVLQNNTYLHNVDMSSLAFVGASPSDDGHFVV